MTSKSIDVFEFDDPRKLVKALLEQAPSKMTHRDFAHKLGFSSSATLSHFLSGRRTIQEGVAHRISDLFALQEHQREFFLLLLEFDKTKDSAHKIFLYSKIEKAKTRKGLLRAGVEYAEYFSQWYFAAVLEFIYSHDVSDDTELGTMIYPPIEQNLIQEILKKLASWKLIKRDDKGYWRHFQKGITAEGLPPEIIQSMKRQMLEIAKMSLIDHNKEQRHISSAVISLSEKKFHRLNEKLNELRTWLMTEPEEEKADRVMHVALVAHPLSKVN